MSPSWLLREAVTRTFNWWQWPKLPFFAASAPNRTAHEPAPPDGRLIRCHGSLIRHQSMATGHLPIKTHSAPSSCFWPQMNESHHGAISTIKFFWKKCPRLSSYFYQAHVTIDVIENQINDNEMTHWHGLSSGAAIQVFFNFLHNRLKCLHVMKPISVSLSNKKSIN